MRVKARRCSTSMRRPSFTSATSTRVVFVPMSTHAQTIPGKDDCVRPGIAITATRAIQAPDGMDAMMAP